MTARVEKHRVVYITYEILDGQGRVFERSDVPIGYVHGIRGPLIQKVEQSLEGRSVGDSVEVQVAPAEGFGDYRPELTFTDDLDNVPDEYRHVGAQAEFQNEHGEPLTVRVTRIEDGKLTVDANHPLAGQTVTFRVRIALVRDATAQEIADGVPGEPGAPSLPH